MKKINELMQERRSARDFELGHEISNDDLDVILNAIRFAPSAHNILNYRVLVMPKTKFRDQLENIFLGQRNFFNASTYILFIAKNGEAVINQSLHQTADVIFPTQDLAELKEGFVNGFIQNYADTFKNEPLKGQAFSDNHAYIGVGVATVAAASLGIDSCIQTGFDHQKLDEFLIQNNLIENDEHSVLGIALGKSNKIFPSPKIAKSYEDFVQVIKD